MSLIEQAHLNDQFKWSESTFGPGMRTEGVVNHIRKELDEVLEHPEDVYEWADILILAFDGAMRAGHRAGDVISAYHRKMMVNRNREWPDWREFADDEPIEHVRD